MAEETTQGILVVSDISGYTDFVRRHTRSASHARQITVRLLKARKFPLRFPRGKQSSPM